MNYYRFLQKPSKRIPQWVRSLSSSSFSITEEGGSNWIYLPLLSDQDAEAVMAKTTCFAKFERFFLEDSIDWHDQWAAHSPNFKNDRLELDLSFYSPDSSMLYLAPGAGFGNLSHPTTGMTLSLIAQQVKGKVVIDIGCGSGILALAALLLGAKTAYGIDIDEDAVMHARSNATLNGLENRAWFSLSEQFSPDMSSYRSDSILLVMNMIRTEQAEAWKSLPQFHGNFGACFTSGILSDERDDYLRECTERGWKLIDESQDGEWMAFHFCNTP